MKSKIKKVKILCSNCKTGEESYAIDPESFACPYICCRSEYECAYYVPINEIQEVKEAKDEGFFKKLISKFKKS